MSENLFKALSIFIDAMRPFAVSFLLEYFKNEPWEGVLFSRLKPDKQASWNKTAKAFTTDSDHMLLIDYNNLPGFALAFKQELATELGNTKEVNDLIRYFQELQEVRNKCNHYQPLDEDEVERAFNSMKLTAKLLNMSDLIVELENIKKSKNEAHQKTIEYHDIATIEAKSFSEDSPLPSWFTNVTPHYDIRTGSLDESVFAANLSEVAIGSGQEVYNNPALFFEKTYVTSGLRAVANRVVKALNGEETDNRVISLQTGFGGGKTHTLISLYHIAKAGKSLTTSVYAKDIWDEHVAPLFTDAKVVVFTNNTTDVVQGRETDDGVIIRTLWGEIAFQLGGIEGYNRIKQNDEERIAPAAGLIRPILEHTTPCLILIDELADYCTKASGIKVGGGNLSDQTIAFIQTLTEVVASIPKCVMIATLPASATEVASSTIGHEILSALQKRIVRVGTDIKPVEDEEIFEVVRRRLFENIGDVNVIEQVLGRYKNTYKNRLSDLPEYAARMEYINKMRKSYPFHPELIDMFRLKWGQDSRFQRTRGVLRLLASIVQDLWKRRGSLTGTQALIHTSDVNLINLSNITGTITGLMGNQWETVMHADVFGTSSNAYKIDNVDIESNVGKYQLTQGIATTLLMASLGNLQNKGLTIAELKLCILKPNSFNHNDINGALSKLEQVAHYLYFTSTGMRSYWFQSKPNINILINQAKAGIDDKDVFPVIIKHLENQLRSINYPRVLINPAKDIPEQKQLTLIVLGPEYAVHPEKVNGVTRKFVNDVSLHKGNSPRVYKNTMFFLTCSETGLSALRSKLIEYMACEKIETEYIEQLDKEQRHELSKRKDECDKLVNEYLIKAYNIVLRHQGIEKVDKIELKDFSKEFNLQISGNLINELEKEEWLINAVGQGLLKDNNLFPTIGNPIQVNDIYEAFLRFDDKPMINGADAIVKCVEKYCYEGGFNVACGEPENFTRIYHLEGVPYLDVTDSQYWLVDKSILLIPDVPAGKKDNVDDNTDDTIIPPEPTKKNDESDTSKTFKSITVSGKIPVERWTDLFSSFVVPLKNNGLEIEVRFKGKSTHLYPLSESSQEYKVIKESARQLGLDLEEEV